MAGFPPSSRRWSALLAAVAVLVGACDAGSEGTTPAPTSTAATETSCPVGDAVPDSSPARVAEPVPLPPPTGRPAGPGLDVATLLPRTGDLAFLGGPPVAAVALAVDDLNAIGGVLGVPVALRHADSAEGAQGAIERGADELLAAGTDVIVGPLSSAGAAAVLDAVARAGAVLVSPGATATALDRLDAGGRLFRLAATEDLQGRALARLVLDDGIRSIDLVVRADSYGEEVARALTQELAARGGTVARRWDRDPTESTPGLGPLREGRPAAATVLVGLAETAPVVDALVAAGRGPRDHPTYGTDGNLGERLGDLVAARTSLECMRGLLAIAPADDELADGLRARLGLADGDLRGLVLDHAAEAYDAVVAAAVAAEAAGAADGAAVAAALPAVTRGGTPCDTAATCLQLAREGADLAYVGRSGRLALDPQGNRAAALLTLAAFDADGHLARHGAWTAP
jgi:branched-chain amino acid transport system substrate-binding protein